MPKCEVSLCPGFTSLTMLTQSSTLTTRPCCSSLKTQERMLMELKRMLGHPTDNDLFRVPLRKKINVNTISVIGMNPPNKKIVLS